MKQSNRSRRENPKDQQAPACLWQQSLTFPFWWSLFREGAPGLDPGSPLCSQWGPLLLLLGLSPPHPGSCQWQRRTTLQKPPFIPTRWSGCRVSPPLAHADDPQPSAVSVFDPLDALQLRVHDERPALAGSQDGGVLSGHPVSGQPLILPRGDVCVIRQHGQRVQVWCRRNWDLAGETSPGFNMTGSQSVHLVLRHVFTEAIEMIINKVPTETLASNDQTHLNQTVCHI